MNSSSGISELLTDLARDFQNFAPRWCRRVKRGRRRADHGTIGDRIGERHAQFDQIGAAAFERRDQCRGALRRGIAGCEIGDQDLAVFFGENTR